MDNAVVITGMGVVSPHGRGVRPLWDGLLAGRSAFAPLSLFDVSAFRNPLAGVAGGYPPPADAGSGRDPQDLAAAPRALRMLADAADEALQDALGVSSSAEVPARIAAGKLGEGCGIVAGTNFGGMSAAETALIAGRTNPARASLQSYLFGAAGNLLARRYGLQGPRLNVSLSCASGTAAIGLALDLVRRGRAPMALACGYDELSLYVYAGLSALRAITPETIRPFDARRKGTLFSEGAGVMVLESEAHARRRQAPRIYAKILGRFMNNDAYHMTAPEQEARGIQALMRGALADAGVRGEDIGHVNLHATGTPYNDTIETKAMHAVFGARGRAIPVCSVKSSIGHCLGAAGIIESIAAVLTLREGKVPQVLGLEAEHKDPACDLLTPLGAPLALEKIDTVLKTSYGFGGTNAAIVVGRAS